MYFNFKYDQLLQSMVLFFSSLSSLSINAYLSVNKHSIRLQIPYYTDHEPTKGRIKKAVIPNLTCLIKREDFVWISQQLAPWCKLMSSGFSGETWRHFHCYCSAAFIGVFTYNYHWR